MSGWNSSPPSRIFVGKDVMRNRISGFHIKRLKMFFKIPPRIILPSQKISYWTSLFICLCMQMLSDLAFHNIRFYLLWKMCLDLLKKFPFNIDFMNYWTKFASFHFRNICFSRWVFCFVPWIYKWNQYIYSLIHKLTMKLLEIFF